MTTPKPASRFRKELRDWALTLGAAVAISFLIQNYAFAQVQVQQTSMDNTLQEGQRLVENRFIYRFEQPARGDIVIINGPESDRRLVKRIIGLPGETLDIREGAVWINGERLDEPYVQGMTTLCGAKLPVTVAEDEYFVLGDNRAHSQDSRQLGTISTGSLEGKAVLRLWPVGEFKVLR
ncbi:MAG: signal peptidase [Paenibacillaceae bacterium]|nr:signal peptidase [Paenibacillaceae bacterium]